MKITDHCHDFIDLVVSLSILNFESCECDRGRDSIKSTLHDI